MAAKVKPSVMSGAHTAGIFADLSVDGPIIGTLVAIVDRAKNLPNRKTIGKQDPYCAARLGKEAKKTTTDVRGGQTPKWDQELRFPVHDSPDYYQLKISVFTDDKRTDLIGEAWVDLKAIIVPGGGQNDTWQTLTCKGKYAGEIRVEITYYDTRPKPDKSALKAKPAAPADVEGTPVKQRSPMKRRPLPSDPVTGEAPSPPPVAAPAPDPYQTPPRAHGRQSSHAAFVPNQSPLQSVEYGTPHSIGRHSNADLHSPSMQGPGQHVVTCAEGPRQMPRARDQLETPPRHLDEQDRDYNGRGSILTYEQHDARGRHPHVPEAFDRSHQDDPRHMPAFEDDRPPPPPVHRSRHNSGSQDFHSRGNSFDMQAPRGTPPASMRHDVLRNEAHRQSVPAYPGRPTFREFDSAPSGMALQSSPRAIDQAAPRHYSYDNSKETPRRNMQPTVEDAPDSPTGHAAYMGSRGRSRSPNYQSPGMDYASSPAHSRLSPSPGAVPHYGSPSPTYEQDSYDHAGGHGALVNTAPHRAYSEGPDPMPHQSHGRQPQHVHQYSSSRPSYHETAASFGMPALPPSLVPGIDPALSQQVADRIYEERRHNDFQEPAYATPARGRHTSEPPPPSYGRGPGASPGFPNQSYEPRGGALVHHSSVAPTVSPQRDEFRDRSPGPQHAILRKSVSPGLPPTEDRLLSDVPFGPDSYDALNPSLVPTQSSGSDYRDSDGKIIMHDGREVDPSDHLPMDSWAPEPEPRPGMKPTADSRSRPTPSGAQPMPPSGRRQLRLAARPQAAPSTALTYERADDRSTPPAPASSGRNRLQKRITHSLPAPVAMSSGPLVPISPDNFQHRNSGQVTPTRGGHRNQPWDYATENHAPQYGNGPPLPAKVPMPVMSGANGGSAEQMALMEEMQRIDIGTGRSRRRGGY